MLRGIFSQRKGKNKGKTPGIMVVKLLLLIKFLRFLGKRKKENERSVLEYEGIW